MRKIGLGVGLTAAALMALTGCAEQKTAPPLPPLDGLLAFRDPIHCFPAADLERLIKSVTTFDLDTMAPLPGRLQAPDAYRSRFGPVEVVMEAETYRAIAPVSGSWRGLKVREIGVGGWVTHRNRWWLGFDAPFEDVLREANAAGFKLGGQGRRVDTTGAKSANLIIAVERDPTGGARLSCAVD